MVEDAFVLCEGGAIAAVGPMRDLAARRRRRGARRLAASARSLASSTATPIACFRRRPRRGVLAAGGWRDLRGAARGGRRNPLDRPRDPRRPARRSSPPPCAAIAAWMLRAGTTTFEGKSGYGLDRETELASLRAIARGRRRPDLARRARGAARVRRRRRLPRLRARRRAARAAELAEAADVFLERGAFDAAQARRYLDGVPRRRASRCACTATSSPSAGAFPLAIELGARSIDHLEATGADGVARACRRATSPACCCRRARSSSDRPMPPARALVDAGAAIALATDFNPGSAFCESLPLVCSLACTQLHLSPAEALAACTVNAAHVLGRADRAAGSRRATTPTSCCSTRPTGATSPTTSAAT